VTRRCVSAIVGWPSISKFTQKNRSVAFAGCDFG
jgi:hypothetical protein